MDDKKVTTQDLRDVISSQDEKLGLYWLAIGVCAILVLIITVYDRGLFSVACLVTASIIAVVGVACYWYNTHKRHELFDQLAAKMIDMEVCLSNDDTTKIAYMNTVKTYFTITGFDISEHITVVNGKRVLDRRYLPRNWPSFDHMLNVIINHKIGSLDKVYIAAIAANRDKHKKRLAEIGAIVSNVSVLEQQNKDLLEQNKALKAELAINNNRRNKQ